mmetsp:Transcript_13802/g.29078  ORF Transcript_13802/g.29078 Transcript_13802/m.29078 type:complete len:555 (-) Transcript_13802:239-1903(-)
MRMPKRRLFLPILASSALLSNLATRTSAQDQSAHDGHVTEPNPATEQEPRVLETLFSTTDCDARLELLAKITLQTDLYPWETSWELRDVSTVVKNNGNLKQLNKLLLKGPPENANYSRNTTYVGTDCLQRGHSYVLKVRDQNGDGMCCDYGEGFVIVELLMTDDEGNDKLVKVVSHEGQKMGKVQTYNFELPDVEETLQPTRRPTKEPTPGPTTQSPTRTPTNRPTRTPVAAAEQNGPRNVLSFIVMADIPYYVNHRYCLNRQLRELDPAKDDDFLFIVHLGDMKYGQTRGCEKEIYSDVAEIITNKQNALRYDPRDFFIVIGDNDWNDCNDPDTALSYWMNNFGNGKKTNGVNTGPNPYGFGTLSNPDITVEYDYQGNNESSDVYPSSASNFAFFTEQILFVGINQVGGGYLGDESTRVANNFQWVKANLEKYRPQGLRTLVIFAHAHMISAREEYFGAPFLSLIRESYPDLFVVYLHGDGHEFDVSYADTRNRNVIQIEADSGEKADPILLTITRESEDTKDGLIINRRGGRYAGGDCDPGNREKTWSSNSW